MTHSDTTAEKTHFDIIVEDGFVLSELSSCVDVIRVANRISLTPPFSWSYHSRSGGPVTSTAEAYVASDPLPEKPSATYAVFIGNIDTDQPNLARPASIRAYTARGTRVILLAEAASRYIRDTDQDGHSTHWENIATLRERPGTFEAGHALATEAGPIITCAGMLSTVDLTLALAGQHVSPATLMTVADIMLHERIRDFGTMQPFSGSSSRSAATATGDPVLDDCIEIMQANIEDPIPIHELVRVLKVSSRSLERKFRDRLGPSPAAYYKELRLRRANNLLLNTSLSVGDIGIACGFPNGFSSLYKGFFGITPQALRKQKASRP
ncbi:helix-turn-helix domain-containing protein [Alisedimentitalea sp. MJ-SS2]|uniref:GlxA family transcriptional regulator n=1 Tax=Aliisedimentitalea sp. MJ-SS2 TaxID=3049795 RepID=UPI0029105A04|nr:helix-turn-helix domain-containing protein [Alisedimentitalea sp. MJ-SS2]MDU8929240.1 helix-turn-helix domain-containing protein [Alisedimentitalea sp. MJ-SS2]